MVAGQHAAPANSEQWQDAASSLRVHRRDEVVEAVCGPSVVEVALEQPMGLMARLVALALAQHMGAVVADMLTRIENKSRSLLERATSDALGV